MSIPRKSLWLGGLSSIALAAFVAYTLIRIDSYDRQVVVLLTAKGYYIYVYGHTDDIGTDEYNRGLSERRARSVRDYLVEAGLDSGIITTRGYGKSSPRVRGTSADARTANRRVEIGIVD